MEEDFSDPRARLLYIIKMTGLNKQEFANKVDVSQSTISQITSTSAKSRNSNISENVVSKVLSAFPQLNISSEWLLTGTGPINKVPERTGEPSLFDFSNSQQSQSPITTGTNTGIPETTPAAPNGTNPLQTPTPNSNIGAGIPNGSNEGSQITNQQDAPSIDANGMIDVLMAGNADNEQSSQETSKTIANVNMPKEITPPTPVTQVSEVPLSNNTDTPSVKSTPEVERVIIFYSDGTFADYRPRKR